MLLATWNLNSLNVRLPHLLDWLASNTPDIVCLQETKLEDQRFPHEQLLAAGYNSICVGQKTYNGVAILTRCPSVAQTDAVLYENPYFDDEQKRLLAATVHPLNGQPLRVISAYVPNGQEVESEKYHYKLKWLRALCHWLREELTAHSQLVLAGDFNIAPTDEDVHDPSSWSGKILCSHAEREAWQSLLDLGMADSFRLFSQKEKSFSWWDYRMLGFQKNLGLRIDHILLSATLARRCTAASIDRTPRKWPRPSDHAPALAQFDVSSV